MLSVIPLLALVLVSVAPPPPSVAQRQVKAPEGLSFVVPAGFSYEEKVRGNERVHVMKRASAVITVAAIANELDGGCAAKFTTRHGLDGCTGEQHVKAGSGAFAALRAGRARVLVVAIASDGNAGQLARTVADSVLVSAALASGETHEVPVVHAPDERLLGCFSSGSSFGTVSSSRVICLRQDLTFDWRSMTRVGTTDLSRNDSASAYGEGADRGTWWPEPVEDEERRRWTLHLHFDDGREATWNVRLYNGDLIRGEADLWERIGG